jgi:hypothetical protein
MDPSTPAAAPTAGEPPSVVGAVGFCAPPLATDAMGAPPASSALEQPESGGSSNSTTAKAVIVLGEVIALTRAPTVPMRLRCAGDSVGSL